jgi:hypothetical protein
MSSNQNITDNNSDDNTTANNSDDNTTDNNSDDNTTNTTNTNNSDNNSDNNNDTNIINFTTNETIIGPGLQITNQQGTNIINQEITNTTFTSTDPINHVPQINETLTGIIEITDDSNTAINALTSEISLYASQITCKSFHGKGSIDDYNELFLAASKIANESKQMQLDIDIDGFNDFGKAADELSALFNTFIIKLQTISIIDDTIFLQSILDALKKIAHLSNTFGKFKETILATASVKIPKSAYDTKVIIEGVMGELNCAMNYMNNFVNPSDNLPNAQLSQDDKNIIITAVNTIDNWNVLCEHGVSIALSDDTNIQYIKQVNTDIKNKALKLTNITNLLKSKLNVYQLN